MTDIVLRKKNESYLRIECEASIAAELAEKFTFEVPNSKFHPLVKARKWDGRIRLFTYMAKEIYVGLASEIEQFAKENDYSFKRDYVVDGDSITREQVSEFMDSLDFTLPEDGQVYDYQKEGVYQVLSNDRMLLVSATSSGKSLMIGALIRWHQKEGRRTLIIVPSISLVSQMYSDFDEYFSHTGWTSKENCHQITAGIEKNTDKDITISTWQSLQEQGAKFFNEYDFIVVDECHSAKAKVISKMLESATDVKYRMGCTGSLDKTLTHEMVLKGLFGPIFVARTTRELIDNNQASALDIKGIILQYSDEEKKALLPKKDKDGITIAKEKQYIKEIDFLVNHERRNKFIANLAVKQTKNTLVLFNYIEHGKRILELINSKVAEGRKVYFVDGDVKGEVREEIRKLVSQEEDSIIVASYKVYSTGVNIRNLHNIVFAHPSKSVIRILQSIGRGLRKSKDKTHCTLFDIGDDLSWKSKKNYSLLHMVERIKIYASEQFDYKLIKVDIHG